MLGKTFANRFQMEENQIVAILTGLAIAGVVASVAFGGVTDGLLQATFYVTQSGEAASGVGGGTGAVVGAAIASSSLSGMAMAGAVLGGAGLVAGAAA